MKLNSLVKQLDEYLQLANWSSDHSQNGLQVATTKTEITTVALAVDANLVTMELAVAAKAGLLLVHHGLLWGQSQPVTGAYFEHLKKLMDHDLGLYGCHLPLDAHPEVGNNAQLAKLLGLTLLQPWEVGYYGQLPATLTAEQVLEKLKLPSDQPHRLLEFGGKQIKRVGIVSGGAGNNEFMCQAKQLEIDLFITGEVSHSGCVFARDLSLNVLEVGHYWSETFGVQAVGKYLATKCGLTTVWLEANTGY